MTEITKNVILDILPLYLAGEVSPDTRALVEKYLETDPELAELAEKQRTAMGLPSNVPVPLTEEDKLKAYKRSKWMLALTIVAVAVLIVAIMGVMIMAFLIPSP
jgi:anti-sigma factor RsiW